MNIVSINEVQYSVENAESKIVKANLIYQATPRRYLRLSALFFGIIRTIHCFCTFMHSTAIPKPISKSDLT